MLPLECREGGRIEEGQARDFWGVGDFLTSGSDVVSWVFITQFVKLYICALRTKSDLVNKMLNKNEY